MQRCEWRGRLYDQERDGQTEGSERGGNEERGHRARILLAGEVDDDQSRFA
jgi:hypothetical protein